jgi:cysteine desulfurase / selenocysteine lyase
MNVEAYRADFPITAEYSFLNHASVSAYNRRVACAIEAHLVATQTIPFDHQIEGMLAHMQQTKNLITNWINARGADEIALVPDTATGINIAANSLPLRAGDNILVIDGDYPANIYPWLNLTPRGILVKWVPTRDGGVDLDVLAARIDKRTRVIAVSTAMFATGFRNDVEAIGALCRERGIYFVVDAIQTLGAFPLDVQAAGIDFVACGGQKWLLGVMGSGFLFCRRELLDELQLGAYVGAASVVDPYNFLDYNFTLQPTADRFALGTPNLFGSIALEAVFEMFGEIGAQMIADRVFHLTEILIADLRDRGYDFVTNLDPNHRSGILIVDVPEPEQSRQKLLDARVVTSVRGAGLRIAPHFYNTEADVLRVGEVLGRR